MRSPAAKTFRQWFIRNLKESAQDIAEHGADAGYPFISYTRDTVKIYDKYEEEIWDKLNESADGQGVHPMTLVASFGRADMATSPGGFKNLLVWFACEELARELTNS
jgi:hypothetical protein